MALNALVLGSPRSRVASKVFSEKATASFEQAVMDSSIFSENQEHRAKIRSDKNCLWNRALEFKQNKCILLLFDVDNWTGALHNSQSGNGAVDEFSKIHANPNRFFPSDRIYLLLINRNYWLDSLLKPNDCHEAPLSDERVLWNCKFANRRPRSIRIFQSAAHRF